MTDAEKPFSKNSVDVHAVPVGSHEGLADMRHADDALLAHLGYKSEFKREFSVRIEEFTIESSLLRSL